MSNLSLLFIAVGVSADAFAVATARSVTLRRGSAGPALAIAATFGFFQGVMPLIGWLVGVRVAGYIEQVDHWIAFGLLAFLGGRMIHAALTADDENAGETRSLGVRELLVLGIATSIDALGVGLGLAFLPVNIVAAAIVIGLTTFVLCLVGVQIGRRWGTRFGTAAEVLGGVVLIGIGLQILYQHLG